MYLSLGTRNVLSAQSGQNASSVVLVLGGNGFIGSSLVAKLLLMDGYKVTTLNRGRHYFDSGSRIDTHDILQILRGRFERYIYISSDSVYEVCIKNPHGGPSREEDAIRPRDPRERHEINMADYYSHQKLGCEEVLQNERKLNGINYVSLRLPYVIGPRDTTDRFWNYQIWLLTHQLDGSLGPVHLNPNINKLLNFVYSEDVSDLIAKLLEVELDVYNEAYNVAFKPVTLERFLGIMAGSLGVDVVFNRTDEANLHWYPPMTHGSTSTAKVIQKLNWKPSSLETAIRSSCEFYQRAMSVWKYKIRRDRILQRYLPNKVLRERFLKDQLNDVSREEL
ncbi:uncharacterized protein LOC114517155 [Dendronephthya gigantea]|uniref:uncharacterized protein LOC114517155 n=1 Tax=Dendronephthya gigantea TaxID=151771 RepID=UPI00106ADC6B|nr:uncharacterized protein LOC114517155 [Dendronephthya gigantea]